MRTDRLTFIRLAGVSAASTSAAAFALGEPAAAWAMNPRFDTTLRLNGGYVHAAGPTSFAPDEVRARVYAHVAQGDRVQSGETGWTSGSRWSSQLVGPRLRRGAADAYGVAYVENQDGSYEWYSWQVAVTLR